MILSSHATRFYMSDKTALSGFTTYNIACCVYVRVTKARCATYFAICKSPCLQQRYFLYSWTFNPAVLTKVPGSDTAPSRSSNTPNEQPKFEVCDLKRGLSSLWGLLWGGVEVLRSVIILWDPEHRKSVSFLRSRNNVRRNTIVCDVVEISAVMSVRQSDTCRNFLRGSFQRRNVHPVSSDDLCVQVQFCVVCRVTPRCVLTSNAPFPAFVPGWRSGSGIIAYRSCENAPAWSWRVVRRDAPGMLSDQRYCLYSLQNGLQTYVCCALFRCSQLCCDGMCFWK